MGNGCGDMVGGDIFWRRVIGFWRRVIEAKYGIGWGERGCSKMVSYGVSMWKNISQVGDFHQAPSISGNGWF